MRYLIVSMLVLVSMVQPGVKEERDVLDEALDEIDVEKLGFQIKDSWIYFPRSEYTLPFFWGIFQEPLRIYEFSDTLANSANRTRSGEYSRFAWNCLLRMGYKVSLYGPNLFLDENRTIDQIREMYLLKMEPIRGKSFSQVSFDLEKEYSEKLNALPDEVDSTLARLLQGLIESWKWREIAFRNCKSSVFGIRDFTSTQPDGTKFYPEVQDLESCLDFPSLYYSGMILLYTIEELRDDLSSISDLKLKEKVELETPLGKVIVGSSEKDVHELEDVFLLLDLGGDDYYSGEIASTSEKVGVSLLIDLGGNDEYEGKISSGTMGSSLLLDVEGNDKYSSSGYSQGLAFFGFSFQIDENGDDKYFLMGEAGQGAGIFGLGVLMDSKGNDFYYCMGDCQGYGGVGGFGSLVDLDGDDSYKAEWDPRVIDRSDYHTNGECNYSNAQGAGFGRRGDGSDGHIWSGGLGVLLDLKGNDEYEAGTFSQGIGYWFGVGILYDKAGNDHYKSAYFTQGSCAHYCIGALLDLGGNDSHELFSTAGAAYGFGWDFGIGFFLEKGGDDSYSAKRISFGCAEVNSIAIFLELGGNDSYHFNGKLGFGASDKRGRYHPEIGMMRYEVPSIGIFVDVHGEDIYDWEEGIAENDSKWFSPPRKEWGKMIRRGIGIDSNEGYIGFIEEIERLKETLGSS